MTDEAGVPIGEHLSLLCCPSCGANLELRAGALDCTSCRRHFDVSDGIPLLFAANEWASSEADVTDEVKAFYEEVVS